jgi:hypothetical protein
MYRQVTCVDRRPRVNPHEGITRLGGRGWGPLRRYQVVTLIEAKVHTFYLLIEGRRAEVEVVREPDKPAYVRAQVDGVWNDDLLALPACRGLT